MLETSWFRHGVRTDEAARARVVRAEHDARDRVGSGFFRQARQLNVAEAVEGKVRLPLLAAALANVGVGAGSAAQVGRVDCAVGIEHFRVAQRDLCPGGSIHLEPHDADHVLAEVIGPLTGGGLGERDGFSFGGLAHRRHDLGIKRARFFVPDGGGRPGPVVVPGEIPGGEFGAGVVGLAEHEVAREHGAGVGFPGGIADHGFDRAVGVGDLQLREERGDGAVLLEAAVAEVAGVPAVGEQRADGVVARVQERGHVVGLVADTEVIVGPLGSEDVIADALAVEARLVEPQRGDVQRGRADRRVDGERPAQVAGRAHHGGKHDRSSFGKHGAGGLPADGEIDAQHLVMSRGGIAAEGFGFNDEIAAFVSDNALDDVRHVLALSGQVRRFVDGVVNLDGR